VALQSGITLEDALLMATANAAEYHGFNQLGTLAPGYQADVLVFNDIETLEPTYVYRAGQLVAFEGKVVPGLFERLDPPKSMKSTVHLESPVTGDELVLPPSDDSDLVRVIGVKDGSITTTEQIITASEFRSRGVNRLAVVERHRKTGRIGRGYTVGFGIASGAIASTVAHDAHNIMVVGGLSQSDSADMATAVNFLAKEGGGQVVVQGGEILAFLPLPIAGLISDKTAPEVAEEMSKVLAASKTLGSEVQEPFMTLSFLGLSVIPELRLTDLGLVDVRSFELVDPFLGR
jgi:adenine deaminase